MVKSEHRLLLPGDYGTRRPEDRKTSDCMAGLLFIVPQDEAAIPCVLLSGQPADGLAVQQSFSLLLSEYVSGNPGTGFCIGQCMVVLLQPIAAGSSNRM